MHFKIINWNVLANCYSFGLSSSYEDDFRNRLAKEERWDKILQIILSADADIICAQEVDQFEYLNGCLKSKGFYSIFLRRCGREDGCMIAFKRNLFIPMQITTH